MTYNVMFAEYRRDGKTKIDGPAVIQSGLSLDAANKLVIEGASNATYDHSGRKTGHAMHYGGLSRAILPGSRNIVEYWRSAARTS